MVHLAQKCNQVNNQNTYWLFEVTKSQLRTGFLPSFAKLIRNSILVRKFTKQALNHTFPPTFYNLISTVPKQGQQYVAFEWITVTGFHFSFNADSETYLSSET